MPNPLNILKNALGISLLLGNAEGFAGQRTSEADKWQYDLINPVPRNLIREMSAD
jgi:hypothetical protein